MNLTNNTLKCKVQGNYSPPHQKMPTELIYVALKWETKLKSNYKINEKVALNKHTKSVWNPLERQHEKPLRLNESEASDVTWVSDLSARGHNLLAINASQTIPKGRKRSAAATWVLPPWQGQSAGGKLRWAEPGCSAASAGIEGGNENIALHLMHRWQFLIFPFQSEIPRGQAVNVCLY